MRVLSLFDGISCGRLALIEAGMKIDKYYSSEIDKSAINVTQSNFPDTIQLGDINRWREWDVDFSSIDVVLAGSPCQGFSSSGKGLNFCDDRSKLYFIFSDILNTIKKHNKNVIFLLENVVMKKEWEDIITKDLGVDPIKIDSALVSAQTRKRNYWTNIKGIEQPEDKKILLESIVEDCYVHSAAKRTRPIKTGIDENGKSIYKKLLCLEVHGIEKSMCLVTVNMNNLLSPLPYGKYIDCANNCYPCRVMTPREMEKLQTVPSGYVGDISSTKAAKLLGNAWNVATVAHILSYV